MEASYVDILAEHPASKAELRVRFQARELLHEHQAMFQALLSEYCINLNREVGYNPDRPNASRRRMVAFADTVPSLRIAVDLKVELFRNAAKPWNINAVHDIDVLSRAGTPRETGPLGLGLGRAVGRLLPRLVGADQERPRPAASSLTAAISEAGKVRQPSQHQRAADRGSADQGARGSRTHPGCSTDLNGLPACRRDLPALPRSGRTRPGPCSGAADIPVSA
jgi:hypothetical protein